MQNNNHFKGTMRNLLKVGLVEQIIIVSNTTIELQLRPASDIKLSAS